MHSMNLAFLEIKELRKQNATQLVIPYFLMFPLLQNHGNPVACNLVLLRMLDYNGKISFNTTS